MATPEEIAWAAGLFEGEGSVSLCNGRARLQLKLTDERVLRRFFERIGRGRIYGPYTRGYSDGFKRQPVWVWACLESDGAAEAFALLAPWLSARPKIRAHEIGLGFHMESLA